MYIHTCARRRPHAAHKGRRGCRRCYEVSLASDYTIIEYTITYYTIIQYTMLCYTIRYYHMKIFAPVGAAARAGTQLLKTPPPLVASNNNRQQFGRL